MAEDQIAASCVTPNRAAEWPRFVLKVSRPGFWLTSIWFYMLPLGGRDVFGSPLFWTGALYVTLPLGALMDLVAQFLDTMELHHDIYTDQWTKLAPAASVQETNDAMPDKTQEPTSAKPAVGSDIADAARASTPPRKGYRSLTAALAELEEQERVKREATPTATAS